MLGTLGFWSTDFFEKSPQLKGMKRPVKVGCTPPGL